MKKSIVLILFICFINQNAVAQNKYDILESNPLRFEKLNPEDGLIHNSIKYIFQDSKGYMWFGSFNGLYKYDGYNFKIYKNKLDKETSLIGNDITTITEDNEGILWVGTNNGLCYYDRNIDAFNHKIKINNNTYQSLSNKINCIYQDSFNIIWIGTDDGLFQVTKKDDYYSILKHDANKSTESLTENSVKVIVEDSNNNLWIGTKKGLNKVFINRQGKLIFTQYFNNPTDTFSLSNNFITSLFIDNTQNLWVGTKNGLNRLNHLNLKTGVTKFDRFFREVNNENSLTDNYITAISKDNNEDIWIGTRYGGLSNYSKGKFTNYKKNLSDKKSLSSNEVSSIYQDKYGVLWIGLIAGGVNKLDLQKKRVAHYNYNALENTSLSDNIVNCIFEDTSKTVWIGTHNGGLNKLKYKDGKVSFIKYRHEILKKNSLSSDNIFSICEDNYGNIWVGTEDSGLNRIKKSNEVKVSRYTKELNNLHSNNVSILYKDHLGDIWVGSFDGDGLMRFTPNKFGTAPSNINHFKKISGNKNSLSSNNISCIYEDQNKLLWVGTCGGGLMRILRDKNNNPTQYFEIKNDINNPYSLSNNNVFSILESTSGDLWIATFGGGINKITAEELKKSNPKIIRYNESNGLTNEEIYGLLEDPDGNLWLSSNKGIYRFNPKTEIFTNYQTNDGFQALNFRKFAYHKGQNGLMYFGGINGFNIFSPKGFSPNPYPPDVEIVDFKAFNQSVSVGQKINGENILNESISQTKSLVLKNNINTFSFEFSGLHYTAPKQNLYKYILEGFDKTWNFTDSKRRYATYSNLDPGTYTFKVKASNNDNIWNKTAKTLTIKVLPPWWKTWWAFLLYFSIIIGLMFLFRHIIVIRQEYQSKLKIEKIEQKNIKKVNAAKLEFFTNISHEFKTPLTLILGPLQHLITAETIDSKVKKSLLAIERNAKNLYKLINEVLEFRKIETKEAKIKATKGDLVKFTQEIVDSFYFLAESKKIDLTFNSNKIVANTFFDWNKLEKIINNLVSNCIKYTPKNGKVKVSLNFNQKKETNIEAVKIVVEDTGIGIPKNQLALIFNRFYQIDNLNRFSSMGSGIGLALTKALVELHNGSIKVSSVENKGSIFTIQLPIIRSNSFVETDSISTQVNHFINATDPSPDISIDDTTNTIVSNDELPLLLMVEDSVELQTFVKETLGSEYNIMQAFDGEDALSKAMSDVPDIIISDIMMPKKDGIELCDTIKRNPITNHIPLILLTARASIEHRIEGLEVGADAYIEKPFHIKHLRVILRELLKQRQLLKEKFSQVSINDNKDTNTSIPINKFETDFINKIEDVILENIHNPQFGVLELGDALNFSRMQLYRKLKSISNMSANEFIRMYRIKRAAKYILETDMNISEIAYEVGFNNLSYFTKCFKNIYEVSPSVYQKTKKNNKLIKLDE